MCRPRRPYHSSGRAAPAPTVERTPRTPRAGIYISSKFDIKRLCRDSSNEVSAETAQRGPGSRPTITRTGTGGPGRPTRQLVWVWQTIYVERLRAAFVQRSSRRLAWQRAKRGSNLETSAPFVLQTKRGLRDVREKRNISSFR